jgi:hypothetical protein
MGCHITKIDVENSLLHNWSRIPAACLFLVAAEHEHIFKCLHFIQAKIIEGRSLFFLSSICTAGIGLFIIEFLSRFCYISVELQLL